MNTLIQDIRYSLRTMGKSPGFTAIVLLTLALGIGANSTIFNLFNVLLLRPLPFNAPEQLVSIWVTNPEIPIPGAGRLPVRYPTFLEWKNHMQAYQNMGAFLSDKVTLIAQGEPRRVRSCGVSEEFFQVLGSQPFLGRTFLPHEFTAGKNQVVILSHALWQRDFGARGDILGETVKVEGTPFAIVGIMPPRFEFRWDNAIHDLWVPLSLNPAQANGNSWFLSLIARLKPEVSPAGARVEMTTFSQRLRQEFPQVVGSGGIVVENLQESLYGDKRPALLALLGAVGFVLLIACANVANLLLSRSAGRRREVAVRSALGASRKRLVRQLLTENVLFSLLGGGLGFLLAYWGSSFISAFLLDTSFEIPEAQIDFRVLAFALLLSLLTAGVSGLVPALQTTRINLNESLKEGGRGFAGGMGRYRFSSLLVVSEVTLSLVLLVAAGLLVNSLLRLWQIRLGFRPDKVLTLSVPLPPTHYSNNQQQRAFLQQLLQRVDTLPNVHSAAVTNSFPMIDMVEKWGFIIEGATDAVQKKNPTGNLTNISPRYFTALGILLLKGRAFTDQDSETTLPVAIISETLARTWWGDQDPIGKRIKVDDPWRTIVGIAGDVRQSGLKDTPSGELYVPYLQFPVFNMHLVLHATRDPLSLVSAIRNEVRALDPNQPVDNVRTMDKLVARNIAQDRLHMLLMGSFGTLALLLAAVGIFGVMSHSVSQRTSEMGIRMALGARQSDLVRLVLREGLKLVVIGVVLGLTGAIVLTRFIASMLYGVSVTDPLTFATVSMVLFLVAALACYIPARRATKVDPMAVLRYE
jgi:putative ABC transport system permease protein